MNEKIIIIITCKTGGQGHFTVTENQVIGMKKRKRVGHKKTNFLCSKIHRPAQDTQTRSRKYFDLSKQNKTKQLNHNKLI